MSKRNAEETVLCVKRHQRKRQLAQEHHPPQFPGAPDWEEGQQQVKHCEDMKTTNSLRSMRGRGKWHFHKWQNQVSVKVFTFIHKSIVGAEEHIYPRLINVKYG